MLCVFDSLKESAHKSRSLNTGRAVRFIGGVAVHSCTGNTVRVFHHGFLSASAEQ